MTQLVSKKILSPDWPQGPSGVSLPRFICSKDIPLESPCTNDACLKTEPNHCCLWCQETCDCECPEKKLNPEFMKEVSLLYRTSKLPPFKKKLFHR